MNKEFINTVEQMRFAQIQYFKTRHKDWLIISKNWEKQVDQMLFDNKNPKLNI